VTYPDPYAGLDPSEWELEQLDEVLAEADAEADAEEAAGLPPGDELPEDGSWHDQLGAIGSRLDARHELDGQRIGEDIVAEIERRPSSEAKLATAMRRIEGGVYTQDAYFRGDEAAAAAARDPLGRYQAACGPLDDFASCSARYHTPECHTTIESAAARGSYEPPKPGGTPWPAAPRTPASTPARWAWRTSTGRAAAWTPGRS
jgi:hypothetical protein